MPTVVGEKSRLHSLTPSLGAEDASRGFECSHPITPVSSRSPGRPVCRANALVKMAFGFYREG
jgi:hypothetical protein